MEHVIVMVTYKNALVTVVVQLHLMIAEFAEEMDLHAVMMEEMEEA